LCGYKKATKKKKYGNEYVTQHKSLLECEKLFEIKPFRVTGDIFNDEWWEIWFIKQYWFPILFYRGYPGIRRGASPGFSSQACAKRLLGAG
jgi:hypothetical protein